MIAFAVASGAAAPFWISLPLSMLLLLAAQRSFQTLVHDSSHFFYSARPKRNDILANWLCAGWIGMEVAAYRKVHLQHHAHNGSAKDPEHTSMTTVRDEGGMAAMIARYVFGMEALRLVRKYFFQPSPAGKRSAGPGKGPLAKLLGMTHIAVTQVLLLAAMAAAGVWWLYPLWLYLALSWNPLLSRLRFLAEHPGEADATVTTLASWLERAFFAPQNFNYHCEHHGWPLVQPYRLVLVHRHLRDERRFFETRPELVARSFAGTLAAQVCDSRAVEGDLEQGAGAR
ncbi:MAG: fatty acid desaturase [Novosphingobium sp.]|nr:fatty acid desaturase [Novosphingobium sp.]